MQRSKRRPLTPEERAEVWRLYKAGKPIKAIVRLLGRPAMTVHYKLMSNGGSRLASDDVEAFPDPDLTTAGAALPEIMAAGGLWSPGMPARYARMLDARNGAMRDWLKGT